LLFYPYQLPTGIIFVENGILLVLTKMKKTFLFSLLLLMITISLKAQKNTDTLLTQSDSFKVSFVNGNLSIKMPSYTFENYLNVQKPFIIRSRNGRHPLLVIDGAISNHDTLGLNVTDIKSITVLKDGSAMKLYGEKGKGGVILITTKNKTN
jgi:TonB-dependent SusC/RagA subfamily outer membrane receptor